MTIFGASLFVIIPIAVIAYACGVVKLGFMVSDATENTGFDVGFYMMTVIGGLALPVAVGAYVFA